jgi:hypothetical protein
MRPLLQDELTAAGAKPVAGSPDLFDLGSDSLFRPRAHESWAERQEAALEALLHSSQLPWYLVPAWAEDSITTWSEVAPGTWRLPTGLCAWAVLNQPGNDEGGWLLYSAAAPVPADFMPDVWRAPVEELRDCLGANSVVAMLASWPDDLQWRLLVTPELLTVATGHD